MDKAGALKGVAHCLERAERKLAGLKGIAVRRALKSYQGTFQHIQELFRKEPTDTVIGILAALGNTLKAFKIEVLPGHPVMKQAFDLGSTFWSSIAGKERVKSSIEPIAQAIVDAQTCGAQNNEIALAFLANEKSWLLAMILGNKAWAKVLDRQTLEKLRQGQPVRLD